jgi:CSLREA domain-containing protein
MDSSTAAPSAKTVITDSTGRVGVPRRLLAALSAAGIGALCFVAPASAATIVPNTTFDETAAGGTCSLREAVSSANNNADTGGCTHAGTYGADTIKLAGGEYHLTLQGVEDANASGDLDVTGSLTIEGVGAGATGIDGNGAVTGDRVLDVFGSGTTLTLAGLTTHGGDTTDNGGGIRGALGTAINLVGAVVSGNTTGGEGGGIYIHAGATLTGSTVSDNQSAASGGGIFASTSATLTDSAVTENTSADSGGGIRAGDPVLTRSTVSGNRATVTGGGVFSDASATINNSTLSNNQATTGGGGGIFLTVGGGTIAGSRISGNSAKVGGGIYADGGAAITQSTLDGNDATGDAGGGLYAAGGNGGSIALTASSVLRNLSHGDGGGISINHSAVNPGLAVSWSTIAGNDAAGSSHQGGGIFFNSTGTFDLTNSTLSGNATTGYGGGLSSAAGATDLRNATINRNIADADSDGNGDGGGIDQASSATLSLENTIVAGNLDTGGQSPDCNANSGTTSDGYNLFGTTAGCFGLTLTTGDRNLAGTNPMVAQLAPNGGPTLTSALNAASPAINAGNPATPGSSAAACAASDQRGVPRSLAGRCDVGAYELTRCEGVVVNVVGTAGADKLNGSSGPDGILGLGGNDMLSGLGGNDGICGGEGKDVLNGGSGTDKCDGGPGTDTATNCEKRRSIP